MQLPGKGTLSLFSRHFMDRVVFGRQRVTHCRCLPAMVPNRNGLSTLPTLRSAILSSRTVATRGPRGRQIWDRWDRRSPAWEGDDAGQVGRAAVVADERAGRAKLGQQLQIIHRLTGRAADEIRSLYLPASVLVPPRQDHPALPPVFLQAVDQLQIRFHRPALFTRTAAGMDEKGAIPDRPKCSQSARLDRG